MKKISVAFLIIFLMISSIVFATSDRVNVSNDFVFESILFDYSKLTNNSEIVCRNYYEKIMQDYEENTFLSQEELENTILYIQDNYNNIIINVEKETFDIYLLKLALEYYSNSEQYSYLQEKHIFNAGIENNSVLVNSTNPVAVLWVCSDPSTESVSSSTGLQSTLGHHSWLVISNLTNSSIYIGGLSVPAGEMYSFGTWTGELHDGIYFNEEGLYYNEFSNSSKYYGRTITQAELNIITTAVSSQEYDKWSRTYNCSSFAQDIWNITAQDNEKVSAGLINTPKSLAQSIVDIGGTVGKKIPFNKPRYYGGAVPVYIGG